MSDRNQHPPIGDYGLIGDCHSAALVSAAGSIDWCCLPRFDSGSAFARLLDHERGGFCSLAPAAAGVESVRGYVEDTLVLETIYRGAQGAARLIDFYAAPGGEDSTGPEIVRIVEGQQGLTEFELRVVPRFDYGAVRPWLHRHDDRLWSAIGGNDALIIWSDQPLEHTDEHELSARFSLRPGERVRLSLRYCPPELLDDPSESGRRRQVDDELERTVQWWQEWARTIALDSADAGIARRSAIMLKALTYLPTGASVAAPTTSLPEVLGGGRNWDYRYAWVRDSSFASRALAEAGCMEEADAFRTFIMRSAAGHASELQVLYGVGGERRVGEGQSPQLAGYRSSAPVRIGNAAAEQLQLDAYGELVNVAWRWHRRGHSPEDDDWRFLASLIDLAAERWSSPDCGIWEWPGDPDHFVHSKVLCWSALDRGIRLAQECMRRAPIRHWTQVRNEIRDAVEARGYDPERGIYVQAFDRTELDAALLLLPVVEYVDWSDPRMARTIVAIREELDAGAGLLYRYTRGDGLPGREGAFVACSFWLAECLARGGEAQEARTVFDQAAATANDLGLFPEEVDPHTRELLGNFPQGLTHLSHLSAAIALAEIGGRAVQP